MNAIVSDAKSHLEIGNAFRSQGRLEDAIDAYAKALALQPDLAEAHNCLGALFFSMGRTDDAVRSFRMAVSSNPMFVDALQNLGVALHTQGQTQLAADAYARALSVNPGNAEIHNNIGTILASRGHLDDAIDHFRDAIGLEPNLGDAHVNLGNVLQERGDWAGAAKCFANAVRISPGNAVAHNNLGAALNKLGQADAAIACCMRALKLADAPEFKANFVECITNSSLRPTDDDFRDLVIRAISEPWAWQSELTNFAADLIKTDAGVNDAILRAAAAWPRRLDASELLPGRGIAILSGNALFRALLENGPVCDIPMERFVTTVRRIVLGEAVDSPADGSRQQESIDFYCAIARQCFITEYVFSCDPDELQRANLLKDRLVEAIESARTIPAPWVAAVAAYWPLSTIPAAATLLEQPWPDSVATLLVQQIVEPREERRLRGDMPRLTAIADGVTRSVLLQYDENPYPRWISLPPPGKPVSFDAFLRRDLCAESFRPLEKAGSIEILIAGCGTGLESVAAAQRFPESHVLAIDLSLSSLCYAKRKTQELLLKNVEYAQADIMQLGSIGRRFDVIMSMGVLHHLADPLAGLLELESLLRPGGVIRLGLYSESARKAVVAARNRIAAGGYAPNATDIRRFRQDLTLGGMDDQCGPLAHLRDFYTTSECRDLLFHVQEHRFTIPQLKTTLAKAGLQFLGFADLGPTVIDQYVARFEDDTFRTNLDYWHYFETEFPDTFIGMYKFWVQRSDVR